MTHYIKNDAGLLVPFAPHIAKRNYIEGEFGNHASMEGLFKLTVRRADGSIKQETEWFKNLILDTGLDHLGYAGAARNGYSIGCCEIGTGTAAPSVTQTQLQSFGARTFNEFANGRYAQPSSPYFYSEWATYRFAVGQLNGNYTEVGIGWLANNLFSRALITPDGVNPAAITVLSDEQLDVSYTLRAYPPSETDWQTNSVTISGTSYSVVGRLSYATSHSNTGPLLDGGGVRPIPVSSGIGRVSASALGAITGAPSGGAVTFTGSYPAYTPGSLQNSATATWGLTEGNVGGVRSFLGNPNGLGYQVQYSFDPVIPKDNTKTLQLTFQCSWARRT